MQLKVKGIVLNEVPYKETSKILSVLTDNYGVISIISKGCKNIKNKLRGVSNKLNYCEYTINYKEKGISNLIEGNMLNSFKNIYQDMKKSIYCFYLVDLFRQVTNENNDKRLFPLLEASLLKINDSLCPELICNIVELHLLRFLGVSLNLESCVICDRKDDLFTVDINLGGLLCKHCYQEGFIMNNKALHLMQVLAKIDLKKIGNITITDYAVFEEIDHFIHEYYNNYTGIYHQKKSKLNNLNYVK